MVGDVGFFMGDDSDGSSRKIKSSFLFFLIIRLSFTGLIIHGEMKISIHILENIIRLSSITSRMYIRKYENNL